MQTIQKIVTFYRDGFRTMTVGRVLWAVILVKVFVLFFVVRFFFFPDYLKTNFTTDQQRAAHVAGELLVSTESKMFEE